jgi:hypothetical protein
LIRWLPLRLVEKVIIKGNITRVVVSASIWLPYGVMNTKSFFIASEIRDRMFVTDEKYMKR